MVKSEDGKDDIHALSVDFFPYVMFTAALPNTPESVWMDHVNGGEIRVSMHGNNLGFHAEFDFQAIPTPDYLARHGKRPNERIVLVTGGSSMHGVGASRDDRTIARRMEHYLNAAQEATRYRVINLGMASWISYQQTIALDLWGSIFDPDWIVIMDGHNDPSAHLNAQAGVGAPMFWPNMLFRLSGRNERGPLETYLRDHQFFSRFFATGRNGNDAGQGLVIDYAAPDPRFQVRFPSNIGGLNAQMAFYLQSQRRALQLFPAARYVLSTQPLWRPAFEHYLPAFRRGSPEGRPQARERLGVQLRAWLDQHRDTPCKVNGPLLYHGVTAFMGLTGMELDRLARGWASDGWRDVAYLSGEEALPESPEERAPFFIDNCHLSDRGQDALGRLYAEHILARDFRPSDGTHTDKL